MNSVISLIGARLARSSREIGSSTIEARLDFPSSTRRATFAVFLSLPQDLRPTRSAEGEGDVGTPIRNTAQFLNDMEARDTGLLIKNEHCLFDFGLTRTQGITCNCYLDAEPARVQAFLAPWRPRSRRSASRVYERRKSTETRSWSAWTRMSSKPGWVATQTNTSRDYTGSRCCRPGWRTAITSPSQRCNRPRASMSNSPAANTFSALPPTRGLAILPFRRRPS